jgi:hypothetical protein
MVFPAVAVALNRPAPHPNGMPPPPVNQTPHAPPRKEN